MASQIYRLTSNLLIKYWQLVACIKYRFTDRLKLAAYFFRIGLMGLFGNLILIKTRDSVSRSGFKYINLTLSKTPLSDDHHYDELSV